MKADNFNDVDKMSDGTIFDKPDSNFSGIEIVILIGIEIETST